MTVGVETTLRLTDTVMLEPDIAVFPKELFDKPVSGFAQLYPGEARLVIEVAASSLGYDRGLKARLYARHPRRRILGHRWDRAQDLGPHGPSGESWSSIVERGPKDALTTPALPGFSIRLGEIG